MEASSTSRIVDQHGRVFSYLRVAVTERCNLRCIYCMPEEGLELRPQQNVLTVDEIARVVSAVSRLGVDKVRLTGGEPLVRHDLLSIVERIAKTPGIERVHLTSNGMLLPNKARSLAASGLAGVNISLDTLDSERFERITRRSGLDKVHAGIDASIAAGLTVKLNVVALRGFNDDELGDFAALTVDRPISVRFIELMPFDAHQVWKTGRFFSAERIVEALHERFPELPASEGSSTEEHCFRLPGAKGNLAVIPAFTRSLCGTCDRIRLTADGQLRNCLYSQSDYNLRELLRSGASEAEIGAFFQRAMNDKLVDGWEAQREAEAQDTAGRTRGSMTEIGG